MSSVSEVVINVDGELIYQKYDIEGLIGQKINGLSSGVIAIVQSVVKATENNADTLYVKYLTAGDSGDEKTFAKAKLSKLSMALIPLFLLLVLTVVFYLLALQ